MCASADHGFVYAPHLRPLAEYDSDFVSVAERFLGVPYLWGGKTALGVDCSGLVQISLAACGIEVPRDTDVQAREIGARLRSTSRSIYAAAISSSGRGMSASCAMRRYCCTPMRITCLLRANRSPRRGRASWRKASGRSLPCGDYPIDNCMTGARLRLADHIGSLHLF